MRVLEQEVCPRRERPIIDYPDSDGEPMADNDPQYRCITDTRFALEQHYHDNPQVYVGADLLIYYVEGDPTKSVAPDVLVSLGVPRGNRRSYRIWKEGKPPEVVFEFASERSWRGDLGWKWGLYQGLGVREYFLFDPTGEHFSPVLQGYRLGEPGKESYRRLPLIASPAGETGLVSPGSAEPQFGIASPAGEIGLISEVLGLELWVKADGGEGMPWVLRLYDPRADQWLPTPAGEAEARRAAEARAAALEAELDRLRTELARETGGGG